MSRDDNRWEILPVAPKYEVSCDGWIRNRTTKAKVYYYEHKGYLKVNLWTGETKETRKKKSFSVHFCVANAFLGHTKDSGFVLRHLDGSRKNNQVQNLRIGTHKENHEDQKLHGTTCIGERNGQCVMTEADAIMAIRLHKAGETNVSIAAKIGVHQSTIGSLVLGKKWKHLDREAING